MIAVADPENETQNAVSDFCMLVRMSPDICEQDPGRLMTRMKAVYSRYGNDMQRIWEAGLAREWMQATDMLRQQGLSFDRQMADNRCCARVSVQYLKVGSLIIFEGLTYRVTNAVILAEGNSVGLTLRRDVNPRNSANDLQENFDRDATVRRVLR